MTRDVNGPTDAIAGDESSQQKCRGKKLGDHLYNLNMTVYTDNSFAPKLESTVRQAIHFQLTISMFGPESMFPNPRKTADQSDSYSAESSPYVTPDPGFPGRFAPYGCEL